MTDVMVLSFCFHYNDTRSPHLLTVFSIQEENRAKFVDLLG